VKLAIFEIKVSFQSRSGKRVHINNTDAEGRMAMADPLNEFKERVCSFVLMSDLLGDQYSRGILCSLLSGS
jgi:hypothetical protein